METSPVVENGCETRGLVTDSDPCSKIPGRVGYVDTALGMRKHPHDNKHYDLYSSHQIK